MTPEAFTAWLRGFMDAVDGALLAAQVEKIRGELAKVAAPEPVQAPTPTPFDWRDWYVQPVVPQYPVYPEPWVPSYPSPTVPSIGWPRLGGGGTWCGTLDLTHLTYHDAPGLTSGVQ